MGLFGPKQLILEVNGRQYRWPVRPLIVVCLDGSSFEYIFHAVASGAAPFLGSLLKRGFVRTVQSAMPSFTNPNNLRNLAGLRNYDAFWIGLNCTDDARSADRTSLVTKEKPWNFKI